jgi:hypothetical protein
MTSCLADAVTSRPADPSPLPRVSAAERLLAELPDLTGNARDIAAAAVIRSRAMRRLRLELCERIRDEVSARWWIDHRHQLCG